MKKALEGDDIEAIQAKQQTLTEAAQTLGQKIYEEVAKQQAAQQAAGGGQAASSAQQSTESAESGTQQEDIVDAEFEVEDEKK